MAYNGGEQQKTIRLPNDMIEEIERAAERDVRSFSQEVRYLLTLGIRERNRLDAYTRRAVDVVQNLENMDEEG